MRIARNRMIGRLAVGKSGATLLAVALIAVAVAAPLSAQELRGQRPAVLPGSTPAVDGETRVYLSGRTFDEAVAHFGRLLGEPMVTDADSRTGDPRVFFAYRSQPQSNQTTRYTGVQVSEGNPENAVPLILRELRGAIQYGHLTQARYDQIVAEYAPIAKLFFASSDELGGPTTTVDAELYKRYLTFLRTGMWIDPEELQAELMRIVRSGDQAAMDRIKAMMEPDFMRAQEIRTTDALVDHWIECLEEIRSHAPTHGHRLRIDMEYEVTISADRKG